MNQTGGGFVILAEKNGTMCGESVTLDYSGLFSFDVQLRCVSVSPVGVTRISNVKNLTVSTSYGKL